MASVIIGIMVAYIVYFMWSRRPKPKVSPLVIKEIPGSRVDMINFIVNKSLDIYEDALLKELQKASDDRLKETVRLFKEIELQRVNKDYV